MGYYQKIRHIPILSREREFELATRARAGDTSARTELYEHNLRLVVSVAQRYEHRREMDDLIQAGNTGLSRAIDKYNPCRGVKFSVYAVWWIRQAIGRSLYNEGMTIRIPVHVNEAINRVLRGRSEYIQTHGHNPTPAELASFLNEQIKYPNDRVNGTAKKPHNYKPAEIEKVLEVGRLRYVDSLDMPVGEDGDTLGQLITDEAAGADELIFKDGLTKKVQASIKQLTDQEGKVIKRRFGFNGEEPETLEAIGKSVGLTRERVRQIEAAALRKLRGSLQQVYEPSLQ